MITKSSKLKKSPSIFSWSFIPIVFILITGITISCKKTSDADLIRVLAELNTGESQDIRLHNGKMVNLKLLQMDEIRDSMRDAVREVKVRISVDNEELTLTAATYNLPVSTGKVRIDCPAVKNYYTNSGSDPWKLLKDARFRLWPKDSPFIQPGTFVYPVKQKWFANMTQSGNEPTYVDWGETPSNRSIYYHSGHDIGGAEGLDEIISATDGLVLSSRGKLLAGYDSIPVYVNPDAVNILDSRGWLVEYAHLDTIDPAVIPGATVKMGQKIGLMGKQGSSGGWVHLHFQMAYKHPVSGKWAIEEAYPYVWEAYVNEYHPAIIAVARPHHFIRTGQEVTLDGSKSKSFSGNIVSYEWTFTDGTKASGAIQKRIYTVPGEYSEILKVTDSNGNTAYDFAVVQVRLKEDLNKTIPVMQAAYHPTLNIKAGEPVTFLVRTFNTAVDNELWDFGDGSPKVTTKCETVIRPHHIKTKFAETVHTYTQAGNYIVRVERADENGFKAVAHLWVEVVK